MNMKVERFEKLDYGKILNGIAAVICEQKNGKYKYRIYDLRNREKRCDDGSPWFEGCFGNSLIYLYAGFTDKLYLLDYDAYRTYLTMVMKRLDTNLEMCAAHTIERSVKADEFLKRSNKFS